MNKEQVVKYMAVVECDKGAQSVNPHSIESLENIKKLRESLEIVLNEQQCFSLKNLAVNGKDLMNMGFKEGREIGKILNNLLDIVLDDPSKNTREFLTKQVEELKKHEEKEL